MVAKTKPKENVDQVLCQGTQKKKKVLRCERCSMPFLPIVLFCFIFVNHNSEPNSRICGIEAVTTVEKG